MGHLICSKRYRDETRAIEKDRAREHRAQAVYGVFVHSSGSQGGYVVREGNTRDGQSNWYPSPYSGASPVKEYHQRSAAQKHADRLNGYS